MTTDASTETEIKLALPDADAWRALGSRLAPPTRERQQDNRFFDTPDRALRHARLALRVRREGDHAWVALKGPKQALGDAAHRLEIETPLADPEVELCSLDAAPIIELRRRLRVPRLVEVVRFDNRRASYAVPLGGHPHVLELDRTRFADGHDDFEVEVETRADAELVEAVASDLRALFAELAIPYQLQEQSKYARALSRSSL